MRSLLIVAATVLLMAGCGDAKPTGESGSGSDGSSDCDLTPIDDQGTLPACAEGTSGSDGPGLPVGFVGSVESSDPISPEQAAAIESAAAENAARNPVNRDPIERG